MTNTRADYVKAFAALTVPLLRARAAAAGIAGRSKMNKAELTDALADFEVAQNAGADVPAEKCLLEHGIKRGRKCSICTEDAAKTPKLTPAQQRALENVFADSIGDVRVDVAFCEPRVRVALEQLGLVRRSRWDLTEEGLRLIKQMGVTPRTNIYDRSDLSWLGDGAYTDARQS